MPLRNPSVEAKVAMIVHQYSKDFFPGTARSLMQEPFGEQRNRASPENRAKTFGGFRVTIYQYRLRLRRQMK
jgi:hypothetical protein